MHEKNGHAETTPHVSATHLLSHEGQTHGAVSGKVDELHLHVESRSAICGQVASAGLEHSHANALVVLTLVVPMLWCQHALAKNARAKTRVPKTHACHFACHLLCHDAWSHVRQRVLIIVLPQAKRPRPAQRSANGHAKQLPSIAARIRRRSHPYGRARFENRVEKK